MSGLKKNINCSIPAKKEQVEVNEGKLSITRQCDLLQLNRSSYYYRPRERPKDVEYKRLIDEIYTHRPYYGSRRIADELSEKLDRQVNRKRVQRLMREMGIEAIRPKPFTSQGNKEHEIFPYLLKDVEIVKPNQVWASDITYIRMRRGFLYLVAVMDWYSRYVISWELSPTLEADFCIGSLKASFNAGQKPEIFNTDQGSQFTSEAYLSVLKEQEVKISMDGKGRCFDNIMVERLWRTVKYEEVYLREYSCGSEARKNLENYITFYNEGRPHSSLDKQTPASVYFN